MIRILESLNKQQIVDIWIEQGLKVKCEQIVDIWIKQRLSKMWTNRRHLNRASVKQNVNKS